MTDPYETLGVAKTASADDIQRLMGIVEEDPSVRLDVDLEQSRLTVEGQTVPIILPETARQALTEGYWDSTAVLAAFGAIMCGQNSADHIFVDVDAKGSWPSAARASGSQIGDCAA